MNKILRNLLIFTLVPGFVFAGGGDAVIGGMAGGFLGSSMAGAMNKPSHDTVVVQAPAQQVQDNADVAKLREEINKLYQKLGSLEAENKMLKEQIAELKDNK